MKIQKSAEDYLETILILYNRRGTVHAIDIANELAFSKPSVSVAMKNLRENGYITVNENNEISLTQNLAARSQRRSMNATPCFPAG